MIDLINHSTQDVTWVPHHFGRNALTPSNLAVKHHLSKEIKNTHVHLVLARTMCSLYNSTQHPFVYGSNNELGDKNPSEENQIHLQTRHDFNVKNLAVGKYYMANLRKEGISKM